MKTKHSKYFELNAEEAIKKFFKKVSIERYIALFFLALLFCFYIYMVFSILKMKLSRLPWSTSVLLYC